MLLKLYGLTINFNIALNTMDRNHISGNIITLESIIYTGYSGDVMHQLQFASGIIILIIFD